MIICIRSDNPDVYIGIFDDGTEMNSKTWEAGRELSVQILPEISLLCSTSGVSLNELDGIVVYKGPGSYTGLRIGMSVANAIGYSQNIPVAATREEDWIEIGLETIKNTKDFVQVSPEYGSEVRTTKPRK